MANTTADTFTSLVHTEMPAPNNEGEAHKGQEQYTNSHQFPEGEGVSALYGEYDEGEWGAEERLEEGEGAPVEQAEVPATGLAVDQGQTGTIEAGASAYSALERERLTGLQVMKLPSMMAKSTSVQSTSMFIMKVKTLKATLRNGLEVRFPLFSRWCPS